MTVHGYLLGVTERYMVSNCAGLGCVWEGPHCERRLGATRTGPEQTAKGLKHSETCSHLLDFVPVLGLRELSKYLGYTEASCHPPGIYGHLLWSRELS